MDLPFVTVLIITWNRKQDVLETICAIYDQSYPNFEIIVIDNGSEDGTVEVVSKTFPEVVIVPLERNVGVAARNVGIVIAKGEIILCLDSDASPGKQSILNLVRKLQAEPRIGVINSKVVNASTRKIDRIAGWVYSEKDKADQDREFLSYSFSETGCAIRKEVFDKVGLFWERLFFGCEGMEFSLRVLDAGYNILYYPGSIIYHRPKQQSRIGGSERDYLFFRNCLYIYLVRFPWWLFLLFTTLKTGAVFLRGMRKGYLKKVWQAWAEFLEQSPSLMKERKPIRNRTAIKYLNLGRQHGQLRWDLVSWLKYKT